MKQDSAVLVRGDLSTCSGERRVMSLPGAEVCTLRRHSHVEYSLSPVHLVTLSPIYIVITHLHNYHPFTSLSPISLF